MFRPKFEWSFVLPIILLLMLGLTIIRSVAPQLTIYQAVFIGISASAFLLFSSLDYQVIFALHAPIYVLSNIFLLTPAVFGLASRGALRWIQIGQLTLQPSELVKPFLIAFFAVIATSDYKHKTLITLSLGFIPIFLIFNQPDLGSALVLAAGWAATLLYQLRLKTVILSALGLMLLVFPFYNFGLKTYQKERIMTFINPYSDPLGRGYHVIQSIIATGSGGLTGKGLGQGTQSQLRFLPEHHTDFIFASLAEELGFVGTSLTIVLITLLLYKIFTISQRCSGRTATLYCLASMAMLGFQAFVNMGMNVGVVPITGITLPFLSYGGSSLLSLGILMGIINSISQNQRHLSIQIH